MARVEFSKYSTRTGKLVYGFVILLRNVAQDEGFQGTIIDRPYAGGTRFCGGIRYRETFIQPVCETLTIADDLEAVAPWFPIRICPIKTKVGGPCRIIDVLHSV